MTPPPSDLTQPPSGYRSSGEGASIDQPTATTAHSRAGPASSQASGTANTVPTINPWVLAASKMRPPPEPPAPPPPPAPAAPPAAAVEAAALPPMMPEWWEEQRRLRRLYMNSVQQRHQWKQLDRQRSSILAMLPGTHRAAHLRQALEVAESDIQEQAAAGWPDPPFPAGLQQPVPPDWYVGPPPHLRRALGLLGVRVIPAPPRPGEQRGSPGGRAGGVGKAGVALEPLGVATSGGRLHTV